VGGKVEGEGSFTVPARSFLEYVSQLPPTHPIVVEKKKGGLFVKTEGFQAQFPVGEADDYPLLPKGKKKSAITLGASMLCKAINQAVFAAARDETRPEIKSVYIWGEKGKVSVVATDSFRLAEEIISPGESEDFSLLLPLNAAQEIVRLFGDQSDIQISPQDNHVSVYGEGVELSSRLVDGAYPDYRQIIPTSWKTRVSVVREDVARALKTLTVFLPRDSRRVQLTVKPGEGKLLAAVVGSEAGQGEIELLCEGEGDDIAGEGGSLVCRLFMAHPKEGFRYFNQYRVLSPTYKMGIAFGGTLHITRVVVRELIRLSGLDMASDAVESGAAR